MQGTWTIYSQNIGKNDTFKTNPQSVEIRANGENFETVTNFPLTGEAVTFKPQPAQQYYLGTSKNYRYRIQTFKDNASDLSLLAGHVATKSGGHAPDRCVFAGLLKSRRAFSKVDSIELKMFHISLYHNAKTPHIHGEIHIDRTDTKARLAKQDTVQLFDYDSERRTSDGIHLVAQECEGNDQIEAKVVFDRISPIYIGYHWRGQYSFMGAPTDKRCTLATIGWLKTA